MLLVASAGLGGPASSTRTVYAVGKIVPIPASIPHEAGDMVDQRILPNLRWIAQRYPIYVTDGYSGPLLNGEHAGCDNCHTRGSDHHNGLAVDIVPLGGGTKCDAGWTPITRLALWAEPVRASPPRRSAGSATTATPATAAATTSTSPGTTPSCPEFQLAEWVEVFPVGRRRRNQAAKRAAQETPGRPQAPARPLRRHLHGPHRRPRPAYRLSAQARSIGGAMARQDAPEDDRSRLHRMSPMRAIRRRPASSPLAAFLAGCGNQDDSTPVACLEGAGDLPERS